MPQHKPDHRKACRNQIGHPETGEIKQNEGHGRPDDPGQRHDHAQPGVILGNIKAGPLRIKPAVGEFGRGRAIGHRHDGRTGKHQHQKIRNGRKQQGHRHIGQDRDQQQRLHRHRAIQLFAKGPVHHHGQRRHEPGVKADLPGLLLQPFDDEIAHRRNERRGAQRAEKDEQQDEDCLTGQLQDERHETVRAGQTGKGKAQHTVCTLNGGTTRIR